jgi:hypothetical protein
MNKRNFDDILNECIERVLRGETVEACLASYPEQAAELEPLLRTTLDTFNAANIRPRPEFRQRAGLEFQAAIRDLKPEKRGFFVRQLHWVTVVSAVLVILLAGSGTVAASANSLPDEPLYAVKMATEDVQLALTTSELGKARLYAEFADRRVDEIIKMAEKGKAAQVVQATDRMNDQLAAMANLTLTVSTAETAGSGTPPALMAAPASDATIPSVTPAPTTAPPQALKAVPAPVAGPDENARNPVSSANLSSAGGVAKPEIQANKAPVTVTARAITPEASAKAAKKVKIKSKADLQATVSEQAAENTQELQDVLERAPDSVKAALKRAIEVADKGYDEALKNMGRKK